MWTECSTEQSLTKRGLGDVYFSGEEPYSRCASQTFVTSYQSKQTVPSLAVTRNNAHTHTHAVSHARTHTRPQPHTQTHTHMLSSEKDSTLAFHFELFRPSKEPTAFPQKTPKLSATPRAGAMLLEPAAVGVLCVRDL